MIAQRDELVNEEQQQQQQQQNGLEEEPAVTSQENRLQNHPQNLRRTRMKWTKEINIDIIRCYFNTILRIPNQPYRKEFYNSCLLYTSPSPRDKRQSRMPSSA